MRDIRSDLRERLAAAETKQAQLLTSLETLENEIATIQGLLQIEDRRNGETNGHAKVKPLMPLEDFIVAVVKRRPTSKEGMLSAALQEGYDVNGRHIHGHLMKLVRDGVLSTTNDDTYVIGS